MMSKLSLLFAALFVLSMPLSVSAMSHSKHSGHGSKSTEKVENKHDHHGSDAAKKTEQAGHAAMVEHGEMFDLGTRSVQGVQAAVHLAHVAEEMAKVGMPHTHHIMVMFMDEKTGEPIEDGTVAVRMVDPAGQQSAPLRMEGMDGHFGTDLILDQKGTYTFTVGTALVDGVRRQFEYSYENK